MPRLLTLLAATAVGLGVLASAGAPAQAAGPAPSAIVRSTTSAAVPGPLAGARFATDPESAAATAAAAARQSGDTVLAGRLDVVARAPQALWFGDWTPRPTAEVERRVSQAVGTGTVPVLVLYAVPHRDCGSYSAGGLSPAQYRTWVRAVAAGLGSRRAVVVVEPDAVALATCLSPAGQEERYALLRDAVAVLRGTGAVTYLDGGHAGWVPADVMAGRLRRAGVEAARGVALNVSGFQTTAASTTYARALASRLPGLHAVVDTSRNGLGPTADAAWCNPSGRALGSTSRPVSDPVLDALLWVKRPGESDGECGRREPAAGTFWAAYAAGLVARAG